MKTSRIPMYVYSNAQQQPNVYSVPYDVSQVAYAAPAPVLAAYPAPVPTVYPTSIPAAYPTSIPAAYHTSIPAAYPTSIPAAYPTSIPAAYSTSIPAAYPTSIPAAYPTSMPAAYAAALPVASSSMASAPVAIVNPLLGEAKQAAVPQISTQINTNAIAPQISPLAETLPQDWAYRVNDIISKGVTKLALDLQNEGFPIRPEFKTITENVYQSEVRNLDFQHKGKEAQDKINTWVKEKTNGKISVLLNDIPSPFTNVIIASALYFNAEWDRHFLTGATARKPFSVEPDQQIQVDMMYNGGDFPFYEDKNIGVKILGLPYKGLDTTMYILLPNANGARALGEFTRTLTPEIIEFLIQNMKNQTCIIGMPRMKISSSIKLKQVLQNLGLTSLFNPATADLSLLSPGLAEETKIGTNTFPTSTMLPTSFTRPSKGMGHENRRSNNNRDQLVFSRFGEEDTPGQGHRRHYFKYFDNVNGYNIEQWATGFSIKKMQRKRRDTGSEAVRIRRQSRPVSEDFLHIVANRNFRSFGLDDLRNSANIANPGLYADEVLHKVEIDISEKGTEAAAASAVVLERDGRQKRLIANRPFLFFIRHNPTKLMLFWGMVNTPTPNYSNT
ncbi:hypothetical protein KPH14_012158 [Odynerus spinipes]|uniref:Serpin domain-containing protein n=1 Tax=Odynerus spinipes TaxID=1348599 RepID=A0AAD9RFB4_9HYME|nr:hypothetical protein KPH14_012158 [Odynerus spinipes]